VVPHRLSGVVRGGIGAFRRVFEGRRSQQAKRWTTVQAVHAAAPRER
jgi:hypothetical protein